MIVGRHVGVEQTDAHGVAIPFAQSCHEAAQIPVTRSSGSNKASNHAATPRAPSRAGDRDAGPRRASAPRYPPPTIGWRRSARPLDGPEASRPSHRCSHRRKPRSRPRGERGSRACRAGSAPRCARASCRPKRCLRPSRASLPLTIRSESRSCQLPVPVLISAQSPNRASTFQALRRSSTSSAISKLA